MEKGYDGTSIDSTIHQIALVEYESLLVTKVNDISPLIVPLLQISLSDTLRSRDYSKITVILKTDPVVGLTLPAQPK